MELFLLPLLLLVGLITTIDGGSEGDNGGDDPVPDEGGNGSSDTATPGDDTLRGTGGDRLFGYAGDDTLTLDENATGLGGAGQDTLKASGNAKGYGMDGDDWLTASDNASVMGGNGDDTIFSQDGAPAYGGNGADTLISSDNDFVNPGTLYGGTGNDLFVVDWTSDIATTEISDFDPAADRLGITLHGRDPEVLVVHSRYIASLDVTSVSIATGDETNDEEQWPVAVFYLKGQQDYDFSKLVVFETPLSDQIDWSPNPELTETLTGGAGNETITLNDSQVGFGLGGDDTLIGHDQSESWGGVGNDNLTIFNAAVGMGEDGADSLWANGDSEYQDKPTVFGGNGDDTVGGFGELHGDAGNDLLRPDADGALFNGADAYGGAVYGGAGDDTILGDASASPDILGKPLIDAGSGNDFIRFDQGGGINAGAGDDLVITKLNDAANSGDIRMASAGQVHPDYAPIRLGAGADVLALDLLLSQADVDNWSADQRSHVLTDFNPSEDELAVILPTDKAGAFTARFETNEATGFIELRLENEISSMTLLLQGVKTAFPTSAIKIYADEAAVRTGTPFATL